MTDIPAYYYELHYVGDFPYVHKAESDSSVFWEDGILKKHTPCTEDGGVYDEEIFVTEKAAWEEAFLRVDQHIAHMQKVRAHIVMKSKEIYA